MKKSSTSYAKRPRVLSIESVAGIEKYEMWWHCGEKLLLITRHELSLVKLIGKR